MRQWSMFGPTRGQCGGARPALKRSRVQRTKLFLLTLRKRPLKWWWQAVSRLLACRTCTARHWDGEAFQKLRGGRGANKTVSSSAGARIDSNIAPLCSLPAQNTRRRPATNLSRACCFNDGVCMFVQSVCALGWVRTPVLPSFVWLTFKSARADTRSRIHTHLRAHLLTLYLVSPKYVHTFIHTNLTAGVRGGFVFTTWRVHRSTGVERVFSRKWFCWEWGARSV